jgi:hypothetical protein
MFALRMTPGVFLGGEDPGFIEFNSSNEIGSGYPKYYY